MGACGYFRWWDYKKSEVLTSDFIFLIAKSGDFA